MGLQESTSPGFQEISSMPPQSPSCQLTSHNLQEIVEPTGNHSKLSGNANSQVLTQPSLMGMPSQELSASETSPALHSLQDITDPHLSPHDDQSILIERVSLQEITQPSLIGPTSQELTHSFAEHQTPPSSTVEANLQELTCSDLADNNEQLVQTGNFPSSIYSQEVTDAPANISANPGPCNTADSASIKQQLVQNCCSQEITKDNTLNESTDTIIMDPTELSPQPLLDNSKIVCIKKQLSSLGLPQNVFELNKDKYFQAESTHDSDIDFIHFTDILDKNCSITLDNLSQEDITFEKGLLKTSSLIHSSSTQVDIDTDKNISEKHDPSYGKPKPVKRSMQPCRAPSASRIAAQK